MNSMQPYTVELARSYSAVKRRLYGPARRQSRIADIALRRSPPKATKQTPAWWLVRTWIGVDPPPHLVAPIYEDRLSHKVMSQRLLCRAEVVRIQAVVAHEMRLTRDDILSDRRDRHFVLARWIAIYLVRLLTPCSTPEMGRLFGGRDHTTILHAINKVEEKRAVDPNLNTLIEKLLRRIVN